MSLSKSHILFIGLMLVPLYPAGSIQLGTMLHYLFVVGFAIFLFLSCPRIQLGAPFLVLFLIYFSPNMIRVLVQEIRFDQLNSILRDLVSLLTFVVAYNLFAHQSFENLKAIVRALLFVTIAFVLVQLIPGTSFLTSHWNPRGIQGFFGLQVGSVFVFSYSLGAFILIASILMGKIKIISIILIALTQSKSIFLALGTVALLRMKRKSLPLYLSVAAIAGYFAYDVLLQRLPYLFFLVETWSSGELDPSTQYRLVQAKIALDSVLEGPFWGYPRSQINIENLYLYTLSEYGLMGASLRISAIMMLMVETLGKGVISTRERAQIIIVVLLAGLSFPVLEAPKISMLLWALMGALYRISQEGSRNAVNKN